MDRNTEIKFIGQPIFGKIINLVEKVNITSIIKAHGSDRYCKAFKVKIHLIKMIFGILNCCDSMTEICEGLKVLGGKLNHLGLGNAPTKSTTSDGLRNQDNGVFEDLYFTLVKKY